VNILVINVSLRPLSDLKLFPVGLGYIVTAIKRGGFDFDLLDIDAHRHSDEEVEVIIRKKKYDVVCIGCIVTGYGIVKALASLIKKYHPRATIIAGNSVATSIVDILLFRTEVDIAVMSEGDETIVDLLHALSARESIEKVEGICFSRNGQVVRTPKRSLIKDISTLPFIDFSLFDVEIYIESSKLAVGDPLPLPRNKVRALPINTARGCIANCGFCYHVFKNQPYRYRSPKSIISEMRQIVDKYSLNYILMWDELTFFSKKQTLEFVETMLDAGLSVCWNALCRANLFNDEKDIEIMKKMKEAGCVRIGYSLESAEPSILKAMKKNITVDEFSKQTELFHKAGIPVGTSLVLGYPQETHETISKTFECCRENRIYPSVGYLLPQPGSEAYYYAKEHNYISDEEEYLLSMGDRQDLRINMTQMTDEEFEEHVLEELKCCRDALDIELKDDQLIKTQHGRASREPNE
jgi:anaerobic magnesium-protoporphyrin IX monomethyl ester cyclase